MHEELRRSDEGATLVYARQLPLLLRGLMQLSAQHCGAGPLHNWSNPMHNWSNPMTDGRWCPGGGAFPLAVYHAGERPPPPSYCCPYPCPYCTLRLLTTVKPLSYTTLASAPATRPPASPGGRARRGGLRGRATAPAARSLRRPPLAARSLRAPLGRGRRARAARLVRLASRRPAAQHRQHLAPRGGGLQAGERGAASPPDAGTPPACLHLV